MTRRLAVLAVRLHIAPSALGEESARTLNELYDTAIEASK